MQASIAQPTPDTTGTLLPPAVAAGTLTLYQFYDVGYAIDLELAQACLAEPTARRHPPVQTRQVSSIEIAQPPLRVDRGTTTVPLGDRPFSGALRASIYDLGTIVIAVALALPRPTGWHVIADLLRAWQDPPASLQDRFRAALDDVEALIRPAIIKPARAAIVEDYSILMIDRLAEDASVSVLAAHPLVQAALLGEQRPLSPAAAALITSLSYCADDLALLSWNGALLADPDPLAAATAADLIEFANVELLQMRTYDASIDAELPHVYQRIAAARRFAVPFVRRYSRLLHDVHQLVLEFTEVTERVDNALKVTDDVYWNRLYSATLNVLRVQVWREGVEHKLALLRETYGMLRADAEAERASALEWIIILLILFEVVMALLGRV